MSEIDNSLNEEIVNTTSVKCQSCGANMVFDPISQSLQCPHCGSIVKINDDSHCQEIDFDSIVIDVKDWADETKQVFHCENCGANVVIDISETSMLCPFCGTAHAKETESLKGLKPNAILPFLLGNKQALDIAKKWAKSKFFAPKKFKSNLNVDNIKGVYIPSFTFDTNTFSTYNARLGETHTRTVGSGKNRRTETYIVWKTVSGSFSYAFDDILVSSGKKISQSVLQKILPYDTNNGKVYQKKYLLGYSAYQYDESIDSCWDKAKIIIDNSLKNKILSKYNYDHIDYFNISTNHFDVKYKYLMLPVYIGNFKFNSKFYNFFINGTTGKIFGKTPKSIIKILLLIFSVLLILVIVFLFFK